MCTLVYVLCSYISFIHTNLTLGETYEFHWPHSSLAACGDSINQYQEPFVDGLLCNDPFGDDFDTLVRALAGEPQLLADNIGVQAQIVTVVNDEDYFFPNFYRGMIVNEERGYGQDITAYLGSRTGGGFGANLDRYVKQLWVVSVLVLGVHILCAYHMFSSIVLTSCVLSL